MKIDSNLNKSSILPFVGQLQDTSFCLQGKAKQTSVKIHVLVVLSYLLVGLGILLACFSAYMATVFHPLVAAASPIGPIALGAHLYPKPPPHPAISPYNHQIRPHPLGFENYSNNCWCNCALVLLFNSREYKELFSDLYHGLLERRNHKALEIAPVVFASKIYEDQSRTKSLVCSSDTQNIRNWLIQQGDGAIKSSFTQEDPADLLRAIHEKINRFLPLCDIEKETNLPLPDPKVPWIHLFPIDNNYSFRSIFDSFFEPNEGKASRKFSRAPKGFLIEVCRAASQLSSEKQISAKEGIKMEGDVDFPLLLELSERQCEKGIPLYRPNGFIVHQGDYEESGSHYVCYLKLPSGSFWFISDALVNEISEEEFFKRLPQATFVHYEQIKLNG